ncbi:hypothetical protein ACHMZP_31680 [Rhodococcus baikonurensis]|uniref:hypothetical protein n=1 Tax=Rhodococcus erythropolis group TaxID=2840174 RepID=UPI00155790E8|nr:hypothetical protein [Rhodococcus erythropolis]PBI88065.1 hypothetical protein BKP42_61450 [Rhodococcus erythropolis]
MEQALYWTSRSVPDVLSIIQNLDQLILDFSDVIIDEWISPKCRDDAVMQF